MPTKNKQSLKDDLRSSWNRFIDSAKDTYSSLFGQRRRSLQKAHPRAVNAVQEAGNSFKEPVSYIPIAGDALDAIDTIDALNKKRYAEAAMTAGMLFLPNIIEKPLKAIIRPLVKKINIKKGLNAIENELIANGILNSSISTKHSIFGVKFKDSDLKKEVQPIQYQRPKEYIRHSGPDDSVGYYNPKNKQGYVLVPDKASPFKRSINRKIKGIAHHELSHRYNDLYSGKLTEHSPFNANGEKRSYPFIASKKDFTEIGVNSLPLNRHRGTWIGSPDEFISEMVNLASRGYLTKHGNNKLALKALSGEFKLPIKDTKTMMDIVWNHPDSKYLRNIFENNSPVTNKEIITDFLDSYYNPIVYSGIFGTLGAGSTLLIKEAYDKDKKENEIKNKHKNNKRSLED